MKVKLNKALKGVDDYKKKIDWPKGTIFDEANGDKIPRDILAEIAAKSKTVTILHDETTYSSEEAGDMEQLNIQLDSANKIIEALRKDIEELEGENESLKETLHELYDQLANVSKETNPEPITGTRADGGVINKPVSVHLELGNGPPIGGNPDETDEVQCPICEKTCKSVQGLKVHLKSAHPDYVYNPEGE